MAEVKHVGASRKAAPVVDGWLLDLEAEDAPEPEIDPYGGRFFGDQVDYESDDADFDRVGGHGLFSF
jgi:hypothetical protein